MECEDLSDLEEGEIFEYEYCSPSDSRHNVLETDEPNALKEGSISHWFKFKDKDDNLCFSNHGKNGYVNVNLKEKLKLNYKEVNHKLKEKNNVECVSSDGEYKSEESERYTVEENKDLLSYSKNERVKKNHSCHMSYGTVEDIMSEIGETISRKSHCGYNRRKSREMKYNLGKFYARDESPHEVWSRKMFSSHFSSVKSKKRRKKASGSQSESEMFTKEVSKGRRCRRKKKKEVHHRSGDEEEVITKKVSNNQVRDFDEVRKSLLEKLKKQKAVGQSKEIGEPAVAPSEQELENSEIQEVEMLIDCTNYVDNPPGGSEDGLASELNRNENMGEMGEDELDVIKLRLIALASNRKRKCHEDLSTTQRREDCSEKSSESKDVEDGDLDRSELLLRAEALKTALLKKHQKRLNKLKREKSNGIASSSDNELSPFSPSGTLPKAEERGKSEGNDLPPCDSKPPVEEGVTGKCGSETDAHCSSIQRESDSQETNTKEKNHMSNICEKKINGKVRGKRKKKKSVSQPSKENTEKSEGQDEDDRALRSQLLSDLMRKKSLKDLERKSVLIDSVQASANKKPLPMTDVKPVSIKRAVLKKISFTRGTVPVSVPRIPKPEIQRIIVHLGSEDSSDEDEKGSVRVQDGQGLTPKKGKENEEKSIIAPRQADEITQANYEKSVELLLSQARKKIEGEMQTAKNNSLDTPEAVYKHLPPSQRLEYMRLKQKIAERERLRKLRHEVPAGSAAPASAATPPTQATGSKESRENDRVAVIDTTPASPACKSRTVLCKNPALNLKSNSINGLMASAKPEHVGKSKNFSVAHPSKAITSKAPGNGRVLRNTLLLPSSQALISKLKLLLKKIKIEKCMEENYEKEISKLKIQLSLFEKKKSEQRFKIKKLAEESMKIYGVIQGITNPEQKVERAKADVKEGEKAQKQEERKAEVEGTVATKGEDKISEAKSESEPGKELVRGTVSEGGNAAGELLEYTSPLDALNNASGHSERVDPNVIVCQFDLMGICKDEECRYQHFRSS